MKISRNIHSSAQHRIRTQAGMAVIVVMALIAIVLIFIAGNLRTIRNLDRDIKLLERSQIHRLQATGGTNTLSVTNALKPPPGN